MNSVANGKVYRRTAFKHMYLPAAAGDAGGAIGAAVVVQARVKEVRGQRSEVRPVAATAPSRHPTNHESPITNHDSTTSDVSPLTSHQIPAIPLRPLTTAYLGP